MAGRLHMAALNWACAQRLELIKMAEKKKKSEQLTQEKIIATFQQLRMDQRAIANKIADVDADKNEHK